MKKRVSRRKNRVALLLLVAFAFVVVTGYLCASGPVMLASLPLLLAGAAVMLTVNRCPNCGEHFRGLYWARENAGYCSRCGELIEFDGEDREDT